MKIGESEITDEGIVGHGALSSREWFIPWDAVERLGRLASSSLQVVYLDDEGRPAAKANHPQR